MTPTIDPNTFPTTSIPTSADQCSWMLWLRSKMRLIQLCPSEGVAERVSVDPARWTLMDGIIWLVSVVFQKTTPRSRPSLPWCSCSSSKTWWLTWATSTLSTNQLIHSSRERLRRRRDKESTCNQLRTESSSMVSMSAFFVLAANLLAHPTGGILRIIWDQQFSCKLTDGSLTQEMSTLMRD